MATDEIEITVEIVVHRTARDGSHFIASSGFSDQTVITDVASADSKRIVFKPTFRVRRNADGSANFLGPFAHGPKAERFVYLNWVTMSGETLTGMVGRIKLHLNHLKWATVEKAAQG